MCTNGPRWDIWNLRYVNTICPEGSRTYPDFFGGVTCGKCDDASYHPTFSKTCSNNIYAF